MRTISMIAVLCTLLAGWGTALSGALFAADPTLTVPATVTVQQAPSLATITATTNCSWVGWYPLDAGVQIVPPQLLKDSHTCVCFVTSDAGGRVLAFAGNDSGPAPVQVCMVTLSAPPPPPPPSDPLAQALQAAYTNEADPAKLNKKTYLTALYSHAASNTVQDPAYTTVNALLTKIANTAVGPLATTDLPAERAVIANYLSKYPGTQTLDAATRTSLGADLGHVADALNQVTGTAKHLRSH